MARRWVHTNQSVFVGDDLSWEHATVVHDQNRETLVIKAREEPRGILAERVRLTAVELLTNEKVGRERHRTYRGTDAEGDEVLITTTRRECACGG